jgi:hypothetical protein
LSGMHARSMSSDTGGGYISSVWLGWGGGSGMESIFDYYVPIVNVISSRKVIVIREEARLQHMPESTKAYFRSKSEAVYLLTTDGRVSPQWVRSFSGSFKELSPDTHPTVRINYCRLHYTSTF